MVKMTVRDTRTRKRKAKVKPEWPLEEYALPDLETLERLSQAETTDESTEPQRLPVTGDEPADTSTTETTT